MSTFDNAGFSEEKIRLAINGKTASNNPPGLNINNIKNILETNGVTATGNRKELEQRLKTIFDRSQSSETLPGKPQSETGGDEDDGGDEFVQVEDPQLLTKEIETLEATILKLELENATQKEAEAQNTAIIARLKDNIKTLQTESDAQGVAAESEKEQLIKKHELLLETLTSTYDAQIAELQPEKESKFKEGDLVSVKLKREKLWDGKITKVSEGEVYIYFHEDNTDMQFSETDPKITKKERTPDEEIETLEATISNLQSENAQKTKANAELTTTVNEFETVYKQQGAEQETKFAEKQKKLKESQKSNLKLEQEKEQLILKHATASEELIGTYDAQIAKLYSKNTQLQSEKEVLENENGTLKIDLQANQNDLDEAATAIAELTEGKTQCETGYELVEASNTEIAAENVALKSQQAEDSNLYIQQMTDCQEELQASAASQQKEIAELTYQIEQQPDTPILKEVTATDGHAAYKQMSREREAKIRSLKKEVESLKTQVAQSDHLSYLAESLQTENDDLSSEISNLQTKLRAKPTIASVLTYPPGVPSAPHDKYLGFIHALSVSSIHNDVVTEACDDWRDNGRFTLPKRTRAVDVGLVLLYAAYHTNRNAEAGAKMLHVDNRKLYWVFAQLLFKCTGATVPPRTRMSYTMTASKEGSVAPWTVLEETTIKAFCENRGKTGYKQGIRASRWIDCEFPPDFLWRRQTQAYLELEIDSE